MRRRLALAAWVALCALVLPYSVADARWPESTSGGGTGTVYVPPETRAATRSSGVKVIDTSMIFANYRGPFDENGSRFGAGSADDTDDFINHVLDVSASLATSPVTLPMATSEFIGNGGLDVNLTDEADQYFCRDSGDVTSVCTGNGAECVSILADAGATVGMVLENGAPWNADKDQPIHHLLIVTDYDGCQSSSDNEIHWIRGIPTQTIFEFLGAPGPRFVIHDSIHTTEYGATLIAEAARDMPLEAEYDAPAQNLLTGGDLDADCTALNVHVDGTLNPRTWSPRYSASLNAVSDGACDLTGQSASSGIQTDLVTVESAGYYFIHGYVYNNGTLTFTVVDDADGPGFENITGLTGGDVDCWFYRDTWNLSGQSFTTPDSNCVTPGSWISTGWMKFVLTVKVPDAETEIALRITTNGTNTLGVDELWFGEKPVKNMAMTKSIPELAFDIVALGDSRGTDAQGTAWSRGVARIFPNAPTSKRADRAGFALGDIGSTGTCATGKESVCDALDLHAPGRYVFTQLGINDSGVLNATGTAVHNKFKTAVDGILFRGAHMVYFKELSYWKTDTAATLCGTATPNINCGQVIHDAMDLLIENSVGR